MAGTTMRRSETFAQQQHEEDIFAQQHGGAAGTAPATGSRPEHYPESTYSEDIKGKFKTFWNKTVIPAFPEAIADVSIMTKMHSIEQHVTKDLRDTDRYPEVARVAEVRRSNDLCIEEKEYLMARRKITRKAFAKYIGVPEADVHPDDVPNVSFGGSGGGFRAMIGMLGYCEEMKKSGLWDILTHVSGVSGSCWSLAAYYSFGDVNMEQVIEHCKKRFSPYHPLSADAIRAVLTAPGGAKTTLGPLIQKHHSGLHTVAMDLYSVFTTGHIFLHVDPARDPSPSKQPKSEISGYHDSWFRFSSAQKHVLAGAQPLPILTAIRHERPWKDWADATHPFAEPDHNTTEHAQAQDAWFQWFEFTPFEVGCDELSAFVPTWGFGRPFQGGKSTMQLPEQSLALLLGLCTSAPAGPLTSYLATISRNLPQGFIGDRIHALASSVARAWGKQGTEEFTQHHPLHACNEHNFLFHYTPSPPDVPRPKGLENSPRIHLIDAGMDNNCPTYVLLHPQRRAEVVLNMDASSDVQKDSFPERLAQIGARRGIRFVKRHPELAAGSEGDVDRFKGLYAQIYDGTPCERPATVKDSYGNEVTNPPAEVVHQGCTMLYMPLLPNEGAVKGFDPSTAKFSGSYNLVWTPEQVDMLVDVCKANFMEGEGVLKEVLREAWEMKREERLARSGGM